MVQLPKHIPAQIRRLPRDKRGYPIPWNVLRRDNGEPVFTVNNDSKHWEAIKQGLCPICGEPLDELVWFVGGPLSAFHEGGCYLDLPMHQSCMTFALRTCPYLAAPKYLGRIDVPNMTGIRVPIFLDHTMIPERPEIFVSVAAVVVELDFKRDLTIPYVRPQRPYLDIQYWQHSKQIRHNKGEAICRAIFGPDWKPPIKVVS